MCISGIEKRVLWCTSVSGLKSEKHIFSTVKIYVAQQLGFIRHKNGHLWVRVSHMIRMDRYCAYLGKIKMMDYTFPY